MKTKTKTKAKVKTKKPRRKLTKAKTKTKTKAKVKTKKPRRKLTKVQPDEIKQFYSKSLPCNTVGYERKLNLTNNTDQTFTIYYTNQMNSRILDIQLGGEEPYGWDTTGEIMPEDQVAITTHHNIIF